MPQKVFALFSTLFSHHPHDHRILHIAGKNQSGKSMLIKEYLGYDLPRSQRSYFVIDTENKFAVKNFQGDIPPSYQERIFQTSLHQNRITDIFDLLLDPDLMLYD